MTCFSPSLLVALSTWPLLQPPAAEGETWPQYHGPHGTRSVAAELDLDRWKEDGPPVAWRVPTELGFSSFAIADGQALTLVRRDEGGEGREVCVALDVETGETRWSTAVGPATYDGGGDAGADGNKGGDGPRSTPSIVGDAVYVFDASFTITCLAAKDGEVRWKHSLTTENEAADIRWQNAAAPVVHDGRLFVAGSGEGQSLLALDARDGSVIWKTGTETPTHATPVVCDLHGVTQVIFYVQSGLVSCDVETGAELWRTEYPFRISSAASPVVYEDMVYVSAGYGVGAGVFRIGHDGEEFVPELMWQLRNKLMNHWSTPVVKDGYLYGMFSFKKYGDGPLKCVEMATGEERWSEDGYGPGNCIIVGDKVVALTDYGEVVVVEATPEAYRELARAELLDGKCWSSPAFADGQVYVRSTREGVRLDLGD